MADLTTQTVFDAVIASLKGAAAYNRDDVARPVAILWPDKKREWESLIPRLRMVLPQFLVFGPYDKTNRSGPAIWLRCVLADRIPDVTWAPEDVPIIYLPGVSRPTLRATEECPANSDPWQNSSIGASSGHNTTARIGPSPPSCRAKKGGWA